MKFKELERGQLLYTKGDSSKYFFFVLKGKLEILVDNTQAMSISASETAASMSSSSQDQFKFSKNADESEFFGLKSETKDLRLDYARAASDKVEVILIDKEYYENIVKRT